MRKTSVRITFTPIHLWKALKPNMPCVLKILYIAKELFIV